MGPGVNINLLIRTQPRCAYEGQIYSSSTSCFRAGYRSVHPPPLLAGVRARKSSAFVHKYTHPASARRVSTTSRGKRRVVRPEIDKLLARPSSWAFFKGKAKRRASRPTRSHTRGGDGTERVHCEQRSAYPVGEKHRNSACVLVLDCGATLRRMRAPLAKPKLHLVSLSF